MGWKTIKESGVPWDDRIQTKLIQERHEEYAAKYSEGWFGWAGMGGQLFRYNPEYKMSLGYVCSHLIMSDGVCAKGAEFQQIAVDITDSLMK